MRLDVDLDQRVAGRTAAHARHALALEAQRLAVLGARRDAHVQRLAVGQLDAFFGALGGLQEADRHGVGDVGARPPHTAGARAEEVGEDVVGADVVAEVEGAVLAAGAAARAGLVAVEAALPRRLLSAGVDLAAVERSEEHTSELQSLMRISYAVSCLKKKTTTQTDDTN